MTWETNRRAELPRDWHKIRARALRRDGHTCRSCGARATHVDHVSPGDDHGLDNLQSLCETCHMRKTGREGNAAKIPRNNPRESFSWSI